MVPLTFPWLLILLLVSSVILLIKKKWIIAAILFVITVFLNSWCDCFCFGLKDSDFGDVKFLSFNVDGGGGYNDKKAKRFAF